MSGSLTKIEEGQERPGRFYRSAGSFRWVRPGNVNSAGWLIVQIHQASPDIFF